MALVASELNNEGNALKTKLNNGRKCKQKCT